MSGDLLIGLEGDRRGIRAHDLAERPLGLAGEQGLQGNQPDCGSAFDDDDLAGRLECPPAQISPDVADPPVGTLRGYVEGRVIDCRPH